MSWEELFPSFSLNALLSNKKKKSDTKYDERDKGTVARTHKNLFVSIFFSLPSAGTQMWSVTVSLTLTAAGSLDPIHHSLR